LCTLTVFGITLWIILVPAPCAYLFSSRGDYQEGTDVYGVKWKPSYSELGFLLSNDSDTDYTDLNILIGINPGLGFEAGGMAPGINQCALGLELPENMFDLRLTSADKNRPLSIPLLTLTAGTRYRVRCSNFAPRSKIEVRVAVVPERGEQRIEPQWAALSVDFYASYRHRHWFLPQCFKSDCGTISEVRHQR
jgi:hypothetical protein